MPEGLALLALHIIEQRDAVVAKVSHEGVTGWAMWRLVLEGDSAGRTTSEASLHDALSVSENKRSSESSYLANANANANE